MSSNWQSAWRLLFFALRHRIYAGRQNSSGFKITATRFDEWDGGSPKSINFSLPSNRFPTPGAPLEESGSKGDISPEFGPKPSDFPPVPPALCAFMVHPEYILSERGPGNYFI